LGVQQAVGQSRAPAPVQIFDSATAPGEQVAPGIVRRYVTGSNATLAKFVFTAGARVPEHSHPNEQVTFVQSGRQRAVVGGRTYEVGEGQAIIIPPNIPHSFEALTPSTSIEFFTPVRQDWIDGTDTYFRSWPNR